MLSISSNPTLARVATAEIGAVGQPSPLSDELAARLLPAAHAIAEPLRQFGAYGPALPSSPDDGQAAELLRYLGRNPSWGAGH